MRSYNLTSNNLNLSPWVRMNQVKIQNRDRGTSRKMGVYQTMQVYQTTEAGQYQATTRENLQNYDPARCGHSCAQLLVLE